jgi:hypothetical protein
MAREQGAGRRRAGRLLPRGASRPGCHPRIHLDAGRTGDRPARDLRPHRLGAALGRSTASSSRLVSEVGGADVDVAVTPPYPTDHRGVVSTLDVSLARSPVLVAVSTRRVATSRPLAVTFHAPGQAGERIRLVRHRPSGHKHLVAAKPTGPAGVRDGGVVFSTRHLRPGRYDVTLGSGHAARCRGRPSGSTARTATRRSRQVGAAIASGARSGSAGRAHPG